MRFIQLCLSAVSLVALAGPGLAADKPIDQPAKSPYEGQVVVRVWPTTAQQLAGIQSLAEDIWNERIGLVPLEVQIQQSRVNHLTALGLRPIVLVEDLQARVDAERAEIVKVRTAEKIRSNNPLLARAPGSAHDVRFWDSFRNRAEIEEYLFALVAQYPELATLQHIGMSFERRPIWAVLISAPDTPTNPRDQRAVVQFNGTQHAREWISPMTVLYLADQLLQRSDSSPRVAGLLETTEFAIVPITNPDGYDHSWTSYRFWRKNRRDNGDGNYGVDLNRNWSYEWGGTGSSGNTAYNDYRGSAPFSEPETTAVADLALSFGTRFMGGIDYHSYSQLILWPWGYATAAQLPEPERTIITDLSIDMAGAINAVSGRWYSPEKATDLYPADGTADDWYQGGTPGFGLTIELRTANAFDPPREHILPCAIENFDAALLFAEGVSQPLRISPTSPIPAGATPGVPVTIEAKVLDALGTLDSATPTLHVRYPGVPTEISIPMISTGVRTYAADFTPTDTRGRIAVRITAGSTLGDTAAFPAEGSCEISVLSTLTQTLFADDFETDAGWTVGSPDDDATTGLWQRGDPTLDPYHPSADTTPGGSNCYVTGLANNDYIRDGHTRLISPEISVPANPGDLLVSADLWRRTGSTDPMLIELAPDSTEDWTTAAEFWPDTAEWQRRTIRVNDFITPAASFRVRFSAFDLPNEQRVEMAVDGFEVVLAPARSIADLNNDGFVDSGDISAFVTLFLVGDHAVDLNDDGFVDSGDIGVFVIAFLLG